jgi:soluble lytic murein transglycosylase
VLTATALVLTACGRDKDNLPEKLATPVAAHSVATYTPTVALSGRAEPMASGQSAPAPTATPSPTRTPTPTPLPPTATPEPQALLRRAHDLHRFGDYGSEQVLLRLFLDNNTGSTEQRLAARYQLALSYLADDRFSDVLATLDAFRQEADAAGLPATDPRRMNASFLLGDALMGLGRYTEAIAAYWAFLAERPEVGEVVQEEIAKAYLALGNLEDAALAYRRAANETPERVNRVRLLEALADVYIAGNNFSDALQVYDEILSLSRNSGYRASIQFRAGDVLAQMGDEAGATARWQAAIDEDPNAPGAYQALIELVNRNVPVDDYMRGYVDLQAGAYLPALSAFERVLKNPDVTGERAGLTLLGMGQSYIGLENYPAALAILDRLIAEQPECSCFGQAWLEKARVYEAQGNGVTARRIYRTFAREYPQNPLAAEALWRSALSAIRADSEVEAATDLLALADTFPNSERAPMALYTAGLGLFMRGLHAQAADNFTRLQENYPGQRSEAATYWLGRALYAGGQSEKASQQWRALVDQQPDTYYGILAAQALANPGQFGRGILENVSRVAGPASTLAGDDGSQAFAETWLAGWLGGEAGNLSQLPEQVATDRDFAAGRLLLELERRGEALAHLERVRTRYQDNPRTLYALSLAFEELGTYRLSIITMARLLSLSPARLIEDTPVFLQRIAYPRHFSELVEPEAQAQGIDPLVLYSLIRQESLFEEGAQSVAAAQGLAQIIPATGEWIAQQMGFSNYTNGLVYRPYINVKFGAYYLAWARNYLDGDLVSALVGYNAGPGNAKFWREIAGADDTVFVELLTLSEPRTYIQQITSHLYHYTRLYGNAAP